jgi:Ala-tRNA(Pro) deacylase
MPVTKLKSLLDQQHVKYVTLTHSPAFTSQEVAALAHVSGKEFAKTVIVRLDDKLAMAVLPANRRIVIQDLRDLTGCAKARFATEEEFKKVFPDCEPGAMPPFGNLYGLEVFVAPELAADEEIAFNAGTHTEVMRMAYRDFERIVHPHVMQFAT